MVTDCRRTCRNGCASIFLPLAFGQYQSAPMMILVLSEVSRFKTLSREVRFLVCVARERADSLMMACADPRIPMNCRAPAPYVAHLSDRWALPPSHKQSGLPVMRAACVMILVS